MPDETPRNYWDSQERIGQVALSDRDVLLVAKLSHEGEHYVRLQVHRRSMVDGVPVMTPGTKGVIVPLAVAGDVAALLRQAVESEKRPPSLAERLRDAPPAECGATGRKAVGGSDGGGAASAGGAVTGCSSRLSGGLLAGY